MVNIYWKLRLIKKSSKYWKDASFPPKEEENKSALLTVLASKTHL
jgi:hypothetical protein